MSRSFTVLSLSVLWLMAIGLLHAAAIEAAPWWTPAGAGSIQLERILGSGELAQWSLSGGVPEKDGGPFTLEQDSLLKRPVLVCGKQPFTLTSRAAFQDVEISYLTRIVTTPDRKTIGFPVQIKDPADPAKMTQIYLVGYYNGNLLIQTAGLSFWYTLRAYTTISPVWPDTVRIPLERDMNSLPLSQDKWVRVRYQMGKDRVRIWVDDRLVADKTDGSLRNSGVIGVAVQPGVRLAQVSVRPLKTATAAAGVFVQPSTARYETIPLDGYVRDRTLLNGQAVADTALPFGRTVMVKGVPVQFARRDGRGEPDHLDVSRSLVRQGSVEGYFPTSGPRFAGAFTVDPARIQLTVPNGRYDALYLIAAFNGDKHRIPELSAAFYRPGAGYVMSFEAAVPSARAKVSASATPLPVKLENGTSANLWLVKIPLDPEKLNSFSDMETLEVELTKKVKQYRSYPDPFIYGWHGGGMASGVQVYAVTLRKAEIDTRLEPTVFGHVWTAPAVPGYKFTIRNGTVAAKTVTLHVETVSYDRQEKTRQDQVVTVPAERESTVTLSFPVKKNGIHTLTVMVKDGDVTWSETRNFCRLAPDTRAKEWQQGDGPMFSYWSYHGGHYTPPAEEIKRIMRMAGARGVREGNAWPVTPQWDWAGADPVDPGKYAGFQEAALAAIRKAQGETPPLVTFFPEPHISRDLTAGNPAEYWGEKTVLTDEEQMNLRVFMNTSKAAAEAVRKTWPGVKILIPWGDPLFIVPFLRAGFPKELFDGSGLDMIGFERLPEQQLHQQSTHRLYILKEEYKKAGIPNPDLFYVEGIFSPTEPGALTWDEQAERYHRWTLLSLAYGIDRFYSGWFAFDCGNYYGAEHYGGCGIQRRIPYSDPKPAYAHYATMTRMLERSKFEKWLPTGSHTVYCLKFTRLGKAIYALWTVRGTRPVTLTLAADVTATLTDSMDNGAPVKSANGALKFVVGTSPVYLTDAGEVTGVSLGKPIHAEAMEWARNRNQETWGTGPAERKPPVTKERVIASFGDGSWTLTPEHDQAYEENNFDTKRFLGSMRATIVPDDERKGSFLAVHLGRQEKERQLMPWYTVLTPKTPVVIPGKACALGIWVKAHSDWGRIVYVLKDARGERWSSVGTRDQWNCNDVHGWSMFNFDGWRYLRFELPASSEYDAFREYGTTWWGSSGGDGLVDLPLRLEKVIVERRTHVIYVNDVQPADPADVLLGELTAEYETPFDATREAVEYNRIRMPVPKAGELSNPVADMQKAGELPGVLLRNVTNPDWGYDGTTCRVHFEEVPGDVTYTVWLSAYPDGRGAVALPWTMKKSGGQIYGLRPAIKLYLWVTYATGDTPAKISRPSNVLEIELVDAFSQK